MARNFIVLRRSPDWLTFDLQDTRAFLAQFDLAEDLILRFAEQWDADFAVTFLGYRQAMKDLSLTCVRAVLDAEVVTHAQVAGLSIDDDDLMFFTDDDDWTHPDLFRTLRALAPAHDGFLWRSIFVGKLFTDTPHEKGFGPIVQARPASDVVYTNNYVATGAAWKRLGSDALLEHYSAQVELDNGRFTLVRVDDYLTAANKHLCCTVCIDYNSRGPGFLDDLPSAVRQVTTELATAPVNDQSDWIGPMLSAYIDLNNMVLGQASKHDAGLERI